MKEVVIVILPVLHLTNGLKLCVARRQLFMGLDTASGIG
tara:strand:- start:237 stop:353 length:117 start_codon:yes stop_codon:yes gene_type:complete